MCTIYTIRFPLQMRSWKRLGVPCVVIPLRPVDAKLLNMHLKGVVVASSGCLRVPTSVGVTPPSNTLSHSYKTGVWLAFETVSNRQGSEVQGNPLWSLEVRADFGQLGLEPAFLLAIFFPNSWCLAWKKTQTNNRKTWHRLTYKIWSCSDDLEMHINGYKKWRSLKLWYHKLIDHWTSNMPKRFRENTPPISSDEEEEAMPSKRKRSSSPIILVDRPLADYSSDLEEDEEKYYAIKPVRQTKSRLFRSKANVYEVDVKKFPEDVSPLAFIPRMLDQLIDDIKRHCQASKRQDSHDNQSSWIETGSLHNMAWCVIIDWRYNHSRNWESHAIKWQVQNQWWTDENRCDSM